MKQSIRSILITSGIIIFIFFMFENINIRNYLLISTASLLSLIVFRLRCIATDELKIERYKASYLRDDIIVSLTPVFNGLVMVFVLFVVCTKRATFIDLAEEYY